MNIPLLLPEIVLRTPACFPPMVIFFDPLMEIPFASGAVPVVPRVSVPTNKERKEPVITLLTLIQLEVQSLITFPKLTAPILKSPPVMISPSTKW